MEPLDFMALLAALVPPACMHLTRYHGAFAPHSKLRAAVTLAHRGVGGKGRGVDQAVDKPITPRHVAMSWARRLKRVFGIDVRARCGGKLEIIASIEEPRVIAKILAHLEKTVTAGGWGGAARADQGLTAPPATGQDCRWSVRAHDQFRSVNELATEGRLEVLSAVRDVLGGAPLAVDVH
jgi:hypothetical protein